MNQNESIHLARKSKQQRNSDLENGIKNYQNSFNGLADSNINQQAVNLLNNTLGNTNPPSHSAVINVSRIIPYQLATSQQQAQAFLVQQPPSAKNQIASPPRIFGSVQNTLPTNTKKNLSIGSIQLQQNYGEEKVNSLLSEQISGGSFYGQKSSINSTAQISSNCPWTNSASTLIKKNGNQSETLEDQEINKSPKSKQSTKFPPIGGKNSNQGFNPSSNNINLSGSLMCKPQKIKEREGRRNMGMDSLNRSEQYQNLGLQNPNQKLAGKLQGGLSNQLGKVGQDGNSFSFGGNFSNQVELEIKGINPTENPHLQNLKAKKLVSLKIRESQLQSLSSQSSQQQYTQQQNQPNGKETLNPNKAKSFYEGNKSNSQNTNVSNGIVGQGEAEENDEQYQQDTFLQRSQSSNIQSNQTDNQDTDEQESSKASSHHHQKKQRSNNNESSNKQFEQNEQRESEDDKYRYNPEYQMYYNKEEEEDNTIRIDKRMASDLGKNVSGLQQNNSLAEKYDKTPLLKNKKVFSRGGNSNPNNKDKELDNILNESISKAPLNFKVQKQQPAQEKDKMQTTQQQQNQQQIVSQQQQQQQQITDQQQLDLSNKNVSKKKKKRNTINPASINPSTNSANPINSAQQIKNKAAIAYENLPKEVQRFNQYSNFCRTINFSNNLDVATSVKPCFKMFVGKGNNSYLIKSSIKQRWWLQLVTNKDQADQCQIVWTQLRQNELIAKLKPYNGPNKRILDCPQNSSNNDQKNTGNKITSNNDSFAESINDISTNVENSPQTGNSFMNTGMESQGDLSDTECNEKSKSLTSRANVKKSNSLNTSLSNLKADTKKQLNNATTASPMEKEARSLTPSTRGTAPQNSIKAPVSYNQCVKRLFHPQDYKKMMEHVSSKDSGLKYFFSLPLSEEFAQTKRGPPEVESIEDSNLIKMHNHLENNWNLSNKKALFYNLRNYYTVMKTNPFENIPLTFHIKDGMNDPEYNRFLEHFKQKEEECNQKEKIRLEYKYSADKQKQALGNQMRKPRNIWIIKPGEITNRGTGITVLSEIEQITALLSKNDLHSNGKPKTYIVQKYLENPLLYNKRKFDIRCYILVNVVKGRLKGYWYQDGYIRTSCKEYNCKSLTNKMIHLTNDAVQKKCDDYGKYEPGNKLSYNDLQRYLDQNHGDQKVNFMSIVYPRMKQLALDCVKSTFLKMDPQRKEMTFEVFGLDFMIDEEFKTWLIEVNTNPCLELSSPLLARIIPSMIENAFRIAIDPIFGFPPISEWSASAKKSFIPDSIIENNKFDLIFDEAFDGPPLQTIFAQQNEQQQDIIIEEEEEEEEEIEDEQ